MNLTFDVILASLTALTMLFYLGYTLLYPEKF